MKRIKKKTKREKTKGYDGTSVQSLEIIHEKRNEAPSGLFISSDRNHIPPLLVSSPISSEYEENVLKRPMGLRINRHGPIHDKDKERLKAEVLEAEDKEDYEQEMKSAAKAKIHSRYDFLKVARNQVDKANDKRYNNENRFKPELHDCCVLI